jgi:hypothetical protein
MGLPVHIPMAYESRYGLLGSMARELGEALASAGLEVNPPDPIGARPGVLLHLNFYPSLEAIPAPARAPGSRVAIAQVLVDHPLAINERQMDALSHLPNYRLLLPSVDGAHLLRLRWPNLLHAHLPHGVPPAALAEPGSIAPGHASRDADAGGRDLDIVVVGSIHAESELAPLAERVPAPLRPRAEEMVELLTERPGTPFEQAADVVLAPAGVPVGQWGMLAIVWRYVTAAVNRRRRLAVVRALEGLDVSVFGGRAWEAECAGRTRYMGQAPYDEIPRVLRRARVCVATGPTQFAHTFSERLLLSMAAGCATVADDRLMARRHFTLCGAGERTPGAHAVAFDADDLGAMRHAVEAALADDAWRASLGAAGRGAVAAGHLWANRVGTLAGVAGASIGATPAAALRVQKATTPGLWDPGVA